MSDIVERLQEASVSRLAKGEMLLEAAGEIERLRGYLVEHEVMRAKLAKMRERLEHLQGDLRRDLFAILDGQDDE